MPASTDSTAFPIAPWHGREPSGKEAATGHPRSRKAINVRAACAFPCSWACCSPIASANAGVTQVSALTKIRSISVNPQLADPNPTPLSEGQWSETALYGRGRPFCVVGNQHQ